MMKQESRLDSHRNTDCHHFSSYTFSNTFNFIVSKLAKKNGIIECDICKQSDAWFCLTSECDFVGCQNHLRGHLSTTKHSLYVSVLTKRIYCFDCNQEILNDCESYDNVSAEYMKQLLAFNLPKNKSQTAGRVGLSNLSNTCYFNSITQCLIHLKLFKKLLKNQYYSQIGRPLFHKKEFYFKSELCYQFYKLTLEYWKKNSKERYLVPEPLFHALLQVYPAFSYEQQDAHECLRLLLEYMNATYFDDSALKTHSLKKETDIKEEIKGKNNSTLSLFKLKKPEIENNSFIRDTFGGFLLSSVTCLTCNYVSYTEEMFLDLSVEIPSQENWLSSLFNSNNLDIDNILKMFFQKETLSGIDAYFCESCNKKRDATKEYHITQLPNVFVIHLKRFSAGGFFSGEKNSRVIKFSTRNSLNLESYLAPQSLLLSTRINKFINNNNTNINSGTSYKLSSFVQHIGSSRSGHYISYNKINNVWYCFDDANVYEMSNEQVETKEAYVLFFEKNNVSNCVNNIDTKKLVKETKKMMKNKIFEAELSMDYNSKKILNQLRKTYPHDINKNASVIANLLEREKQIDYQFWNLSTVKKDFISKNIVNNGNDTSKDSVGDYLYEWIPNHPITVKENHLTKLLNDDIVYVPIRWYTLLSASGNPGPLLFPSAYICEHGKLDLFNPIRLENEFIIFPKKVAEELITIYGGDISSFPSTFLPCINCSTCKYLREVRKHLEYEYIKKYDVSSLSPGQYWFAVPEEWIVKWKQFILSANSFPLTSNFQILQAPDFDENLMKDTSKNFSFVSINVWFLFALFHNVKVPVLRTEKRLSSQEGELDISNIPREIFNPPFSSLHYKFITEYKGNITLFFEKEKCLPSQYKFLPEYRLTTVELNE